MLGLPGSVSAAGYSEAAANEKPAILRETHRHNTGSRNLKKSAVPPARLPRRVMLRSAAPMMRVLARSSAFSTVSKRSLTLEEAMTSNHLILESLQLPAVASQLTSLRASTDLLTKWQQTNAMLVQATMAVLPQVGFPQDFGGLQAFTEAFAEQMRTDQVETQDQHVMGPTRGAASATAPLRRLYSHPHAFDIHRRRHTHPAPHQQATRARL